jgi:predicted RNA-binding protein YlxR (DUF448 family)
MLGAAADAGAQNQEVDAGPRDRGSGPERLCIATRTPQPPEAMIRFVVGPAGDVVPDVKRKLPGRGAWVTGTREAVRTAVKRNAFARAFKRQVAVSDALVEETERLLRRAALDALAIAGKAGLTEAGFSKVEAALQQKRVKALLQAEEAAPDGVRKLAAAARRRDERDTLPVVKFTSAELDLALGRSNVIHAALLAGPASEALLARCRSLDRFRGREPANPLPNAGSKRDVQAGERVPK